MRRNRDPQVFIDEGALASAEIVTKVSEELCSLGQLESSRLLMEMLARKGVVVGEDSKPAAPAAAKSAAAAAAATGHAPATSRAASPAGSATVILEPTAIVVAASSRSVEEAAIDFPVNSQSTLSAAAAADATGHAAATSRAFGSAAASVINEPRPSRAQRQRKVRAEAFSELESLWETHLGGMFFNSGADISEFVLLGGLSSEDVVKAEFDRLTTVPTYFSANVRAASDLKHSASRLFGTSWYDDIIVSCLCTVLRAAVNQGPWAGSVAVLGSLFLTSLSNKVELDIKELMTRLRRHYDKTALARLKTVLIVVNTPCNEGSTVANHFALLEVNLSTRAITVYDSLGPSFSSVENIKGRLSLHVQALQLLFDEVNREMDLPLQPWSELQICSLSPQQTNEADCGAYAVTVGYFLGMGRCVSDILVNFPSGRRKPDTAVLGQPSSGGVSSKDE